MFGLGKQASFVDNPNIQVQVFDQALEEGLTASPNLVGAIDQGTSSTRFLLFTVQGQIAASAQMEHTQIFPNGEDKVGWHEHDPLEIWTNVVLCIQAVQHAVKDLGGTVAAVGITNQRETTIAWNAQSGKPYYNAIVWDDTRTSAIANQIACGNTNRFREKTGLPLASYFAGTKVRWLLDNVQELADDIQNAESREHVRFGTIDTWLMYQLTGKPNIDIDMEGAANMGGLHLTDVSNASRWLFCDIAKVEWDQYLVDSVCCPHSVPLSALPEIRKSSEVYAKCTLPDLFGVPLSAILGDQQAALFGQCAFEPGEAKNTYGTGLFLMMNTGTKRVPSNHGLLTTIAYQIDDKVIYALEGSISHSGSTIQWLRDQLCIISDAAESETLARTTDHNDGLYFVPAFAGLFAPHWRSDARACIVGMTATHRKGHVCRAALEAAAYQTREVFDAIYADSHVLLKNLRVDGGGTNNKLLMQFQSDVINVPVVKPKVMETTSMGAAFAAGLAVGVWKNVEQIRDLWSVAETFQPLMTEKERTKNWAGWTKAVTKSLDWVQEEEDEKFEDAQEETEVGGDAGEIESIQVTRELMAKAKAPLVQGYSTSSLILMTLCGLGAGIMLGRRQK